MFLSQGLNSYQMTSSTTQCTWYSHAEDTGVQQSWNLMKSIEYKLYFVPLDLVSITQVVSQLQHPRESS